jgi:hypothetical protein
LDAVGGADAKGWKKRLTLFTPMVRRMASSFLFFTNYPKVTGFRIIVPKTGS